MKLLRAALAASRSRAWSVAIGRSGLVCHCEKGEPVTARKANHNASNATVVTAGKMVCVCVCVSSIGGQTAGPTKFGTHMRMDLGMVPTYKKWTSPPKVEVGILGGQKIKSPGYVMNCTDNQ